MSTRRYFIPHAPPGEMSSRARRTALAISSGGWDPRLRYALRTVRIAKNRTKNKEISEVIERIGAKAAFMTGWSGSRDLDKFRRLVGWFE